MADPTPTSRLFVTEPRAAGRSALPRQPTALIGREQDVAVACARLREPDVRLLTLTGPGGVGKTRLAIEVAVRLEQAFADGAVFVPLQAVDDARLVVATIARGLGVREVPGQPVEESLREALCTRHMLLVLDNFEQVLEAAPLVAELLAGCPDLKVLVTSRAALRIRGEKEFAVPSLAVPGEWGAGSGQSGEAAAEAMASPAVTLLVERARDVRPGWGATAESAPVLGAICRRLDGLPLALELAAGRSKVFAPPALLARLDGSLSLLTDGPRDLPARQRTLRGAIAWSYDLLPPAEQAVFRRLAVFAGGCTLEAAAAVAIGAGSDQDAALSAEHSLLDLLAALVEHNLLRQDETADGESRFWMLETLREFGWEQLVATGEADVIRDRHAAYVAGFVEQAEGGIRSVEALRWGARVASDLDNVRAALSWCVARRDVGRASRIVWHMYILVAPRPPH